MNLYAANQIKKITSATLIVTGVLIFTVSMIALSTNIFDFDFRNAALARLLPNSGALYAAFCFTFGIIGLDRARLNLQYKTLGCVLLIIVSSNYVNSQMGEFAVLSFDYVSDYVYVLYVIIQIASVVLYCVISAIDHINTSVRRWRRS